MKAPFEIKGYWWLPDEAENKLPGILSIHGTSGAYLDIYGDMHTGDLNNLDDPKIIHGISQLGRPVTLYKCFYKNISISQFPERKLYIHVVFDGVHFETEYEIKFNSLYGSYTDLDTWVDISGFNIEFARNNSKYLAKVDYEKPSDQYFDIDESYQVGISFSCQGPEKSPAQTRAEISQETYLVVKSKAGDIDFDSCLSKLGAFSSLLQLASQRIIYPIELFGYSTKNGLKKKGIDIYYPPINIYFQPIESMADLPKKIRNDMLFTFKDLDSVHIKNWFGMFEKQKLNIDLYQSLFFSKRLFIETRFLFIVQALESLHSFRFVGEEIPKAEFSRRRKLVLDAVPQELQEWVGRAINNANNKPFILKISELLNTKSNYFDGLILDLDQFARQVRDTRNQFVHISVNKSPFSTKEELVSAIKMLAFLFELYLLESIGFSDEKIRELVEPKKQSLLTGWKHLRSSVK